MTRKPEEERRTRPVLLRAAPLLVLVALLILTIVATVATSRRIEDRSKDELDQSARSAVTAVDRRVQVYNEVLEGLAGLFEADPDISPAGFERYLRGRRIIERYAGVDTLGFAQVVPKDRVRAFLRDAREQARSEGIDYPEPSYVENKNPGPALVVARWTSASLGYRGFGFDLYGDEARGVPSAQARATGRAAATPPLRLLGRDGDLRGFGIVVPVYGGKRLPPAPSQRVSQFRGVVFAGFRISELLRNVLGQIAKDINLEVYDLGIARRGVPPPAPKPSQLAFNLRPVRKVDPERTRDLPLTIGGRQWVVRYSDASSGLGSVERRTPTLIAVGGVLLSLLAAALLRLLTTANERAIRRAEQMTVELRASERELARSNAELEHFAYLASHDLQEPLRTITSYVGLLERRLEGRLDEKEASWLRFISGGGLHMSRLISDLLEYSRAGRRDRNSGVVELETAWEEAIGHLAGAIADAGADVSRGPLPAVTASGRDMTSILQNLVGNALKYRREGVAPQIRAEAVREGENWQIRVTDNGIGIDPRFHDRVFDLFQRLHTSDEYAGTGMGLAIVRKLAEANGGTIHVESDGASGSTFVLTIPALGGR